MMVRHPHEHQDQVAFVLSGAVGVLSAAESSRAGAVRRLAGAVAP